MSKSQIDPTALTTALTALKLPKGDGKQIKFIDIAKAMDYRPKKIMKGKETKLVLKEGSTKYKEGVYAEVMRRYNEKLEADKKKTKKPRAKKVVPKIKEAPKVVSKKLVESVSQKFYDKYLYETNTDNLKDMYDLILKEISALGGATYVSIPYKLNDKNGFIWRSIGTGYLDSFEDFQNEVNTIAEGTYGSDAITSDIATPVYNIFAIGRVKIAGHGKSESMIFKVKGLESKKGNCGYEALKECGFDCYKYGATAKDMSDLIKIVDTMKKAKVFVEIIANGFTINKSAVEIVEQGNKHKITIKDKKRDRMYVVSNISMNDIQPVSLFNGELNEDGDQMMKKISNKKIIYDEINQHYDIIEGEIELVENVKLSTCSKVILGDKVLFTPKQVNCNTQKETKMPVEFLFFDYETIIDFNMSSCMKPYSLSVLRLSPFELKELEELDVKGREGKEGREDALKRINDIRTSNCMTYLGYDCNDRFIDWFCENQHDKMFVFIGFNNANFDNFLLLEGMLNYKVKNPLADYSVREVFYNGSQLLNFRINGRHNCFDIRKHLMGSLKKNCKDFRIESCAKKEFNHNTAQDLYDKGELIDFITGNDELKEYNEYDVLSTAVLYARYSNALVDIPATKLYGKDIYQVKTIGSLIYKVFTDNKNKMKFDLPKLEFETYNDLQKSKIAGRVEMFNGVQKVNERLVSTDVCSLYPFVMAILNCYYPCGKEIIEVSDYKGDDELGFYYCDIDQSNLKGQNLPNIYAKKNAIENDWSYDGVLENYLISNVMIGLLRKFGCKVEIKKGFVFPNKLKSCEMFGFLLDFMKEKNKQDTLGKTKSAEYNPALRETLKLLMNSLSGKVIEGLHTEKTIDIDSAYEFLEIKEKAKSINFINAIGNKMFLTYEIDPEEICKKQQRPIYLGVLIYDYAKRYMYENSYSKVGKNNLLYTDTDASKFRYRHFLEWKNWVDSNNIQVPHWKEVEEVDERYKNHKIFEYGSKVFGAFEDELEDYIGDNYTFYCLEKKSWLYGWEINGKWKAKYRFKGINGRAQLLTLEEPFIESKTIRHKATETKPEWNETKYSLIAESERDVYNYYNDNTHNNIEEGNEIKFFEKVYSTGTAYVLCNSFRKIVKNSSRNVDLESEEQFNNLMNKIQVNYIIKKIQLKNNVGIVYNEDADGLDDVEESDE